MWLPARVVEELEVRPFLILAVPLIAGVATAAGHTSLPLGWLAVISFTFLLAVAFSPKARILFAALLGFSLGMTRQALWEVVPATDVSRLNEGPVELRGVVVDAPRHFVALSDVSERHAPPSGAFLLDVKTPGITGRLRVQFYDQEAPFVGGEEIEIHGKLRALADPSNPGTFNRKAAARREGIGAVLIVDAHSPIRIVMEPSWFSLRTILNNTRAGLRDILARHSAEPVAALQSALLLGSRENLPEDFNLSLQRTGTAHFLAISGANLVLILGIFWVVLLLCGLRGPSMHVGLLLLLLGYTALTGWQMSVVRAFLMSATILAANLFWRRANVVNSMSLAAVVIVLIDPAQIFDAGFQLSFIAVLGLIGVSPIFHNFLSRSDFNEKRPKTDWAVRSVRSAVAVSLGAWLATAPIVLATFNLVTPVILLANLVLSPLMTVQAVLGIAILPLSQIFPPAATLVGSVAGGVFDATSWSAGHMVKLPAAFLFSPSMPAPLLIGYYVALALWTLWARLRPTTWNPWLCGLFAMALTASPLLTQRPSESRFGMIDVGRGSCAYLQSIDGQVTVFDCGSLSIRDPGATIAAPVLWSRGILRVQTLVLSHSDQDHINGARSLIERMRVSRLIIPPRFEERAADLVAFARSQGLEILTVNRGQSIGGLEVLGPPKFESANLDWPVNELSVVIRTQGILIPGDIEERGTQALLEGGDITSNIMVVPHHGKLQNLHRALLDRVAPMYCLVSAPEGYGSREVIDELKSRAKTFTTGESGWIECQFAGGKFTVRTYKE